MRLQRPPSYGLAAYASIAPAGGIAARSGTTPGTATVTLYRIRDVTPSDAQLEVMTDANGDNVTVTAYNLSQQAIVAGNYIQLKQELLSGKYLVDYEECDAA